MEGGLLQRLDAAARNLVPLSLALIAVIVGAMPMYMPGYGAIAPNLALIAVVYWAIYRPDLFPAVIAFAVGLVQDAVMGTPLGMNALVLLCAHAVIVSQRRFFQGKSFAVVWWAFSMVAFGAAIFGWALVAAIFAALPSPAPALFGTLLTVALHPFFTWIFARTHHAVLGEPPNVSR
jgi:rod shape-determining protein MreD